MTWPDAGIRELERVDNLPLQRRVTATERIQHVGGRGRMSGPHVGGQGERAAQSRGDLGSTDIDYFSPHDFTGLN